MRSSTVALIILLGSLALAETSSFLGTPADLKKLSVEELMNIEVISVTKQPTRLSETPAAVQVITGDDIRRSGATTLAEALRLVTNLQVAQKGSHNWGITARGFNTDLANKLLVLIDGRTVYTPLFSGVFWDRQDYLLEDVERIEVVSGPGGTLWGANAVNGVINVITQKAEETQGIYVEGGGGTELRGGAGGRFGTAIGGDDFVRVYGRYAERDGAAYKGDSSAQDSWDLGQVGFRLDSRLSPRYTLSAHGDYYRGDEDLVTGGTGRVSGGNLLGRWEYQRSESSQLSLQAYVDHTHLYMPVPALIINSMEFAPAGELFDDLDTYDMDVQHRFRLTSCQNAAWGFGWRFTHDVVRNAPGLAFFPPVLNQQLFNVFFQNEVLIGRRVEVTFGTKLEHNDYTGWEAEPSGRVLVRLSQEQILWGAISRSVRTPSRIDRDVSQPAPPYLVVLAGGKSFASETVVASELGYRAQLGKDVAGALSLFYNDYDHVRSTSMTPTTILPFFFENNLAGHAYGLEFTSTVQVSRWWRLVGGLTVLRENLHVKPGSSDFNDALNETADPGQQFGLRSSMNLPGHIELDAHVRWVGELRNNNGPTPGRVPGYAECDCRLGWSPVPHVNLSLVGQNLFHSQHPEYGFPTAAREEIQRSVYGKVECRF